jgi:hypothetical protein
MALVIRRWLLLLLLLPCTLLRTVAGTATVYVRNKRAKDRQLLDTQLGLEGKNRQHCYVTCYNRIQTRMAQPRPLLGMAAECLRHMSNSLFEAVLTMLHCYFVLLQHKSPCWAWRLSLALRLLLTVAMAVKKVMKQSHCRVMFTIPGLSARCRGLTRSW